VVEKLQKNHSELTFAVPYQSLYQRRLPDVRSDPLTPLETADCYRDHCMQPGLE